MDVAPPLVLGLCVRVEWCGAAQSFPGPGLHTGSVFEPTLVEPLEPAGAAPPGLGAVLVVLLLLEVLVLVLPDPPPGTGELCPAVELETAADGEATALL